MPRTTLASMGILSACLHRVQRAMLEPTFCSKFHSVCWIKDDKIAKQQRHIVHFLCLVCLFSYTTMAFSKQVAYADYLGPTLLSASHPAGTSTVDRPLVIPDKALMELHGNECFRIQFLCSYLLFKFLGIIMASGVETLCSMPIVQ